MAFKFANGIEGVTSASLTSSATTLQAGVLTSVPAVTGTDRMAIVLDPDAETGAPEIVHITSHTAGANTATILRGQEGTSSRSHVSGTKISAPVTASALDQIAALETEIGTLQTDLAATDITADAAYEAVGEINSDVERDNSTVEVSLSTTYQSLSTLGALVAGRWYVLGATFKARNAGASTGGVLGRIQNTASGSPIIQGPSIALEANGETVYTISWAYFASGGETLALQAAETGASQDIRADDSFLWALGISMPTLS